MNNDLIDKATACKLLGIQTRSFDNLISNGKITKYGEPFKPRYSKEQILKYKAQTNEQIHSTT